MGFEKTSLDANLCNIRELKTVILQMVTVFWTVLGIFSAGVIGYNLDTRTSVVHQGPNGSMFGFSIALHRDRGFSWLLVGAPKAQTEQPDVEEGGAVYRCSTERTNVCQMIPFDRSGPGEIVLRGRRERFDKKSHQWFGATVHSSGENGAIVACAPRYVYYSTNLKRRDPVGTCWVVRGSFTNFQEYSPCRTTAWGYHRQGSCQAGFSATVTKDGRRLFIGAVGSWYWQGQLFSQDLLSKQSLHTTAEAPEHEDDSYLGYSVAVGEFTGDKDTDVVVGVPRGNNLMGKVSLFNSTLASLQNITGEQLGAYFGYSVCVSDFNNDRLDDIAVGAPLYSNLLAKDGSYEKGRVYIIYQNAKHNFTKRSQLDGLYSKGRFGLSLAAIDDIDKDGYKDLAVGCPYGGEDGKGVVFIFHGSSHGVVGKPAQIITSSDIPNSGHPNTFGFALAGGLDMDTNQYPDLLIGAYDSDTVLFLRSRPIIQPTASLRITPEKINLDDKGCKLLNGSLVSCVVVSFCLSFKGVGTESNIGFIYQTKLDADSKRPRVYFLVDEEQSEQNVSVDVRKEIRYCKSVYAYIQNNVRDKLTPISVQVTYSIYDPHPNSPYLKPILNQYIPNSLSKQINIQKNCGQDNLCIPDLKLEVVPNMKQFIIGDNKRLQLEIILTNRGEDAFESMLYLEIPVDFDYVNIGKVKPKDIPVSCSGAQLEDNGFRDLVCDTGNPLPANTTLTFKILLAPSHFLSASSDLKFAFLVNSTNNESEETQHDNQFVVKLPVKVEVNMIIHGISEPQTVTYNKTEKYPEEKSSETDAGPEVVHVYAVGNKGPSMIREAEIDILWPMYTLYRRPLLYLMEQPEVQGKGHCQEVEDVNPLSLKKEQKKPRSSSYSVSISDLPYLDFQSDMEVHDDTWDLIDRQKRETPENATNNGDPFMNEMSCGPTLCTRILCTIYNLTNNEQVIFTIRSRLWKDTLDEMGLNNVQISSKLVSRVTSLPYDVDPSQMEYRAHFVTTKINPEETRLQLHLIPWWIIIASVSVGLLILGLLALLLFRFGFFRRRRPRDQMEEPLHYPYGNGYHLTKGDEYL